MNPLITSLNGKTVLLLESREVDLIRQALEMPGRIADGGDELAPLRALNRGVQRGLEHLQAEFKGRKK